MTEIATLIIVVIVLAAVTYASYRARTIKETHAARRVTLTIGGATAEITGYSAADVTRLTHLFAANQQVSTDPAKATPSPELHTIGDELCETAETRESQKTAGGTE